jgi:uncharacterized membrane protein SpoIIM required for sporulation
MNDIIRSVLELFAFIVLIAGVFSISLLISMIPRMRGARRMRKKFEEEFRKIYRK